MSLRLFLRHAADIVILDLHGRAIIGPANDILNNQLRRLIEEGNSKVLINLTDVTQLDSSSIGTIVNAFCVPQAPRCEPEIAPTPKKCEAGNGNGALAPRNSDH
jgi:hypothetical protein